MDILEKETEAMWVHSLTKKNIGYCRLERFTRYHKKGIRIDQLGISWQMIETSDGYYYEILIDE